MQKLESVLAALLRIRAPRTSSEYDLHDLVREALAAGNLAFGHEVPVAPRRRIDFLCQGIGIEIKRGKPTTGPLMRQLSAYADSERIEALVLVAERLPGLPDHICGKPLRTISLNKLWGIAL